MALVAEAADCQAVFGLKWHSLQMLFKVWNICSMELVLVDSTSDLSLSGMLTVGLVCCGIHGDNYGSVLMSRYARYGNQHIVIMSSGFLGWCGVHICLCGAILFTGKVMLPFKQPTM